MKKLSIYIASTDTGGNKIKTPLDKPFSGLNVATKQAIVIETTHAAITTFMINFRQGMLRLEFQLGGYDAADKFRANPDFIPGAFVLARVKNQAFWDANVADKAIWNFENMVTWLVNQKAVEKAAGQYWGIANLEAEVVTT